MTGTPGDCRRSGWTSHRNEKPANGKDFQHSLNRKAFYSINDLIELLVKAASNLYSLVTYSWYQRLILYLMLQQHIVKQLIIRSEGLVIYFFDAGILPPTTI
jgi:hypothetical protein